MIGRRVTYMEIKTQYMLYMIMKKMRRLLCYFFKIRAINVA